MKRSLWMVGMSMMLLVLCLSSGALAADDPSPVPVGKAKPSWKDLPGVDGKSHSLSELKEEVVVVAITCNHCPVAIGYVDRLKEFAKTYVKPGGKVALVAISVSDLEADKLPAMKQFAKKRGITFAYLYDESQDVARALGASATPHFFVLNKERVLVYRGAWDDANNPAKVKTHYIEDAVKALLAGRNPKIAETDARGCSISFKE